MKGVAKLAAIFGAILASAGSNFWPERQCQKLSVDSSKIQQVDVVRNGDWQRVDIPYIVVGNVVFLKPGDQVPADGLYLDTESSIQVDKLETDGQSTRITVDGQENPFFLSDTNVVLGYACMVVTSVGKNRESQTIKLDGKRVEQFENLTSVIGNQVSVGGETHISDALAAIVGIVATPAMIAVTSTPRGLLLAVKIALAYSMKKLIDDDVLLRKPSLCNAIGSVTTICTNATRSLTMDSKESQALDCIAGEAVS
ncbi:hypothetical protein RJ640_011478 [Escallonia rubra]|uniref:P-type ATPase A domain-containing protein n=1 Tax=Escallonia rubra TaxID=112253 RepID=A0AA88UDP9_9ASTE|nr:hypothetical protein RJ640_011478 [Escallonia rubra]